MLSSTKTFAVGVGVGLASSYLIWKYSIAHELKRQRSGECSKGGAGEEKAGAVGNMSDVLGDEVLKEQLTRNIQFFGEGVQLDLAKSFVVVVGLGGVGSHAAHFLLRSGVGKLRLVDFDQVTLSSLNRHALATRKDVGIPKATCLKKHFSEICPECEVESMVSLFDENTVEEVLGGNPDFVIDAIDNIDTKVKLLLECKNRGIEVLCVCGAGGKADPTRIKIADIAESTIDSLGRSVRHKLRRIHSFEGQIPALFSTETPRCGLVPFDDNQGNPLDFQIVPNFRVRTIPVLGTTPAIFGMAAAAYVLTYLAGAPLIPEPVVKIRLKELGLLFERLKDREEMAYGSYSGIKVDLDEVEYLVRSLWCGCCAFVLAGGPVEAAKLNKGLWRNTNQLALVRWNEDEDCTMENLVLMNYNKADDHMENGLKWTRETYPEESAFIERRIETLKKHLAHAM